MTDTTPPAWTEADFAAVTTRLGDDAPDRAIWEDPYRELVTRRSPADVHTYLDAPGHLRHGWVTDLTYPMPLSLVIAAKATQDLDAYILFCLWEQASGTRWPQPWDADLLLAWGRTGFFGPLRVLFGGGNEDFRRRLKAAQEWMAEFGPDAWRFHAAGITDPAEARAVAAKHPEDLPSALAALAALRLQGL